VGWLLSRPAIEQLIVHGFILLTDHSLACDDELLINWPASLLLCTARLLVNKSMWSTCRHSNGT
jgi:hypothetical protein